MTECDSGNASAQLRMRDYLQCHCPNGVCAIQNKCNETTERKCDYKPMLCVQPHCQQCVFLWKTVYRRPKSRFHTNSCSEATDLRVEVTATMLHPVKRGSERLYTSKHDAIGRKARV